MGLTAEVRRYVIRKSKPQTVAQIADALGVPLQDRKLVYFALNLMHKRGEIQKWHVDTGGRIFNGYSNLKGQQNLKKPLKKRNHN